MILFWKTKLKVSSPDRDTDFFNTVAGILQWDTLTPYVLIICRDYVLWTSIDLIKENGFSLKMARNRRYLEETITDADYAGDIGLLANTTTSAESMLHSLHQIAGCISLRVDAIKMDYMYFNRWGAISTLNGCLLKLVNKFTHLDSSLSSTEVMSISTERKCGLLSMGYQSYRRLIYPIKQNRISSKQRLCQYYCTDAPHERWQIV